MRAPAERVPFGHSESADGTEDREKTSPFRPDCACHLAARICQRFPSPPQACCA